MALLRQSPEYTAEAHSLFAPIPEMLRRDLHFLHQAMEVTESYIVMGGNVFLEANANVVVEVGHGRSVGCLALQDQYPVASCTISCFHAPCR